MTERYRSLKKIEVSQFDTQQQGIEFIIGYLNSNKLPKPSEPEISKKSYLTYIEATANNDQIGDMQEELWDFLDRDEDFKEIYIDDPQSENLFVTLIEPPFHLNISEAELAKVAHDGFVNAASSILENFSPELRSNPECKIDFILWRRDLAERFLDKVPTGNDTIFYLPTNVPGANIEFFYPEGSNFPLRSLYIRKR